MIACNEGADDLVWGGRDRYDCGDYEGNRLDCEEKKLDYEENGLGCEENGRDDEENG